ncbi:MAG: gliding motility-associated C-terminal domain-containing protein [Bacteroidales bacterium]|nr:gliding motility-associated C-terminal domain-containing protein [Bacteroidales bacterium]
MTDIHGNTNTCTQDITVTDDEAPTFTVPADVTICRNPDCAYDSDPSVTGDVTDEWDNCSMSIEAIYNDDFTNLTSCDKAGYIIRTWTLSDASGNELSQNQIIWVEAVPVVVPLTSDTIQCDSTFTNIQLTSPSIFTSGNITFNYTVTASVGVTGYTSPVSALPLDHIIADQLINPTNAVQTVTYNITPINPTTCPDGVTQAVTIYVNPTPQFTVSSPDTLVCDASSVVLDLTDGMGMVEGTKVYELSRTYDPADLTVITGQPDGEYYLSTDDISDQLINNTDLAQSITYHFVARIRDDRAGNNFGYCDHGIDTTITIWINPTPNISVEASDSVLCNGETTVLTVTNPNTSVRGNWIYYLEVDADPLIGGAIGDQSGVTTPSYTQTLTNNDTVVRRVQYHFIPRIDPVDGGDDCENGRDTTIVIWVNPTPEVRVTVSDTVLCDGDPLTLQLRNPNNPILRIWDGTLEISVDPGITGVSSGSQTFAGDAVYNYTLNNTSNEARSVSYRFIPRIRDDDGDWCNNGIDTTIVVWVNPVPDVLVEVMDTLICNEGLADIKVNSLNPYVRGDWFYNLEVFPDAEIIGARPGGIYPVDSIQIQDLLTNMDTVVHKVIYRFTPRIGPSDFDGDCENGRDTTVTIWVNPTPEIRVSADSVICSEGTATIQVDNPNFPIRGNWTYDLVVTPDPGITGASGSQAGITTTLFNETLSNNSVEAQKVEYHFTPWIYPDDSGADCGGGRDTTITVWVNPTPRIEVEAPDTVLCNDEDVLFEVKIPNVTAHGEWKYNMTVDYGEHVTGLGIGGEYTAGDLNLMDHLVNHDTVAHRIPYHFTPRITPGNLGADCGSGVDTTVWIWVNPTPEIRVNIANTMICNEDLINLFVRNPNIPVMGDWKYNLTVVYDFGMTGNDIGGEYDGTDVVLTDHLINHDTIFHFVDYIFTPRISPGDLGIDCENGIDTTIRVWVNPTPAIRVYAQDSILCNGDSANIWISNPNIFVNGAWEYNLVVNPDPQITGARSGVEGIADTLLIDPLINHDTIVHKVEYTFTPTKTPDPDLCAGGNDTTIVIWVNPTPEVRVTVSDTVLCDGDPLTLQLRNPNNPILRIWDGTLEISVDPGITGVSSGSQTFAGDAVYNYTLNNTSNEARSVSYRFIPRIRDDDGDWCNNGIDTTIVVWVNPVPDVLVEVMDTLICNEGLADIKVNSLNPYVRGDWFYNLEVFPDAEIIGARPGGIYPVDSIQIQDLLTNMDTVVHKVIYRFTPRIGPSDFDGDCENGRDTTVTIWVNPTPRILVSFPDTIFCNNDTAVISVEDGLGLVYGVKEYTVSAVYGSEVTVISRASGASETLPSGTPITDIYINHSLEAQPVDYTFTARIRDTRPGHFGEFCYNGPVTVRIWINPSPGIQVAVPDTIICDNSTVEINVSTSQGSIMGGTLVYDLVVSYDPLDVSGSITPDGEFLPDQSISDLLINNSVTVQLISYHFTARIRDDRLGHEGGFCNNGSDTTVYIYLNPVPGLDYTLLEDSLCYDDGFTILTDSLAYATHPLYFELVVTNDNGLLNVIDPSAYGDTLAVANNLDQSDVLNPHTGYGRLSYNILPFISTEGCMGTDTTFFIDVNPEPRMTAQLSRPQDTAVCFDQGYLILMNENIDSTTGNFIYDLNTFVYNEPNVDNERLSGDYLIENLDQTTVINNGYFIEDITYRYIPVIRNVNGQGKDCPGTAYDSITVQVAPELIGLLEPDTSYVGGHAVRCYGLEDVLLHSNVRGGYNRNPYDFDWYTLGGSSANMVPDDSIQTNMGEGLYWFDVVDAIGCAFGDTITLTQPDTLVAPAVIVDATCLADNRNDGSIDISPTGGIEGYSYQWTGPFGYNSTAEDVLAGTAGPYRLTLNDTNRCEIRDLFWIGSAKLISIDTTVRRYGNYEVSCFGESTGEIVVNSISGGFPGYTLIVEDENTGAEVYNQPVAQSGGTYSALVSGLPAGEYRLWAYDTENCYNMNQGDITNVLSEPDTISITRLDIQPVFDTVDISCFGADDGFIDIEVSGGHTADYPNTFLWTGPPGESDLVPGDSLQSSLSGGTYNLLLTDRYGCEQTAEYTLYEPAQILLEVDSVRELNGWNITCFGDNDGFIEISSSGGIESHAYLWSPGRSTLPDPTQQDIYDLVADTFHLTITDSLGCTLNTVFELIEPNPLGLDTVIPRINDWEIACAGDSTGSITLIPLGGADSLQNTYLWSTDIGNLADPLSRDQAGLREGNYTVLVTDINGCTYLESYELLDPDPLVIDTFMVDSAFCFGSATGKIDMVAYGGVDPFNFLWNNGELTEDIDSLLAGVYTIVITDDNGCILIDSAEVFEADHFGVELLVASDYHGAVISCTNASDGIIHVDTLGGTPPYTYSWNTGATTRNLANVPAGTYRLVVIDQHGCVDSAQVVLEDPLPLDYSMQLEDPLCYGDASGQIELLITGGTIYTVDDYEVWVNDVLTGRVTGNLPSGIHQVRIEDLNDCFVETEAELIDPDSLELSFDTEDAFCRDKPDGELRLYIDGGIFPYDISWNMGLPDNEDSFNEIYPGEYIATVTDAHACVMTDTIYIGYTHESCLVIPNAFSPNGDGYNDLWMIEGLELYPSAELRIFDRWGSRVYYSPNAADDPWDGTFDGRRLPIDSYHYIIRLENGEPAITGNVTIVR